MANIKASRYPADTREFACEWFSTPQHTADHFHHPVASRSQSCSPEHDLDDKKKKKGK
jgi:hypothetical protein